VQVITNGQVSNTASAAAATNWPGVPQRRPWRFCGTLRHRLSSIARGHSDLDDVTKWRDRDDSAPSNPGERRRAGGGGRIPNQLYRATGFCLAAARLVLHLDFPSTGFVAGEYQLLTAQSGRDSPSSTEPPCPTGQATGRAGLSAPWRAGTALAPSQLIVVSRSRHNGYRLSPFPRLLGGTGMGPGAPASCGRAETGGALRPNPYLGPHTDSKCQ
jgi:hypothetical protein